MRRKNKTIFPFIFMLIVVALLFSIYQNNKLKKENASLNDAISDLKKEIQEDKEGEEDTNKNTFEEDVIWFISEIYTNNDRADMYDNISFSITDDVAEFLFGTEIPPKSSDFSSDALTKKIENVEVFGKYTDEKTYKAIVRFDLSYEYRGEVERSFTVVQVDLKKYDEDWLINNFVEYTTGFDNKKME